MMITLGTVHVTVQAAFHVVKLDIPQDVINQGQKAIEEWASANIHLINNARPEWTETMDVVTVEGVDL